ncbi:39S ribosomal protein L51, mitochondrial-like [Varroa jacobsoni]|uniref:Large ribosomal subunit protein mL51 n=1 Tax=Varroa destructor TaxID=109461 RepID=A0A7M7MIV6_VARDE|nr:39S ribosomal protein L51, mitochondrial-like isoform X2 [Varroa destructor]XP_022685701.1 39S ribosomal protein L51, mitochondrial-like [Varroa jacobsoni]
MLASVKNFSTLVRGATTRRICSSVKLFSLKSDHVKPTKLTDLHKYETESVRGNRKLRRFGYETKIAEIGFLPRLQDSPEPINTLKAYKPKNAWTEKRALFGQNDYIDILGEPGKARPTDNMQGVPPWLRGFQGNEYQMLLLKRQQFAHWKVTRPKSFHDLSYRIRFLFKKLNNKTKT